MALALQDSKLFDKAVFVGSSARSLVALAMALNLDFKKIKDFQLTCVRRTHGTLRGAFQLRNYVEEIMDKMLPDDAVEALQSRVEISITRERGLRNRRIRVFRDRDHLRSAVLASCCMAPLCGMPFRLDGGFRPSPGQHERPSPHSNTCPVVTRGWCLCRANLRRWDLRLDPQRTLSRTAWAWCLARAGDLRQPVLVLSCRYPPKPVRALLVGTVPTPPRGL